VVATQRRLHGRVLPADDQHPLAEVLVRVIEVVADVRQVLARHPELARPVGAAGREDQVADAVLPRAGARTCREQEVACAALNVDDRLVSVHSKVIQVDDRA
jgi:hypothetical protein